MIKALLTQQLAKAILIVLAALVLYGVYSGTALAVILVLFVGLRLCFLAAEALRKPVPAERWEALRVELTRIHEQSTQEERAEEAVRLELDPRTAARELAQARVNHAMRRNPAPRRKGELIAEVLGLVTFALLIPADFALFSRDFFSLRTPQGWSGTALVALCLVAYAWPHRWLNAPRLAKLRMIWWTLPFCPACLLLNDALETRHPYLNPFHPEHTRLAAERILSLKNNVVAGRHADWVLHYARQLDERAQLESAAHFYREGLRLDANCRDAAQRLAVLERQLLGRPAVETALSTRKPSDPFWSESVVAKSPRRQINSTLEDVDGCTVVLVAIGDVPEETLDAVGDVIRRELDLPVLVSSNSVALPPSTRVRGLITGRQWDHTVLVKSVQAACEPFPQAPIKYVCLTPVDIYGAEVNYTFSMTYEWGALVSFARFEQPKGDIAALRHRTAKQALCALIKSFKVPMSPERNCVTSYTRSLEEFDAKGNRPNAATLSLFRQAIVEINGVWLRHKETQRMSK